MQLIARIFYFCLILASVGLIAAFVIANNQSVTIQLMAFNLEITAEIWVFLFAAFAAGMLTGGLFIWLKLLPLRTKNWASDRKIKQLTNALDAAEKKAIDDNRITQI
jgi:uncharacterized membrane protein YciS (DUF1049 family)